MADYTQLPQLPDVYSLLDGIGLMSRLTGAALDENAQRKLNAVVSELQRSSNKIPFLATLGGTLPSTVTVGATGPIQTVGSTTGWGVGNTLVFQSSGTVAVIQDVIDAHKVQVTLPTYEAAGSILTTATNEAVFHYTPRFYDRPRNWEEKLFIDPAVTVHSVVFLPYDAEVFTPDQQLLYFFTPTLEYRTLPLNVSILNQSITEIQFLWRQWLNQFWGFGMGYSHSGQRSSIRIAADFGAYSVLDAMVWEAIAEETAYRLAQEAIFVPKGRISSQKIGELGAAITYSLQDPIILRWHSHFLDVIGKSIQYFF